MRVLNISEIKIGKIPKKFLCFFIILLGSIYFFSEISQVSCFSINRDIGTPEFAKLSPRDTLVNRGLWGPSDALVAEILLMGTNAEIGLPIIKAVVIDMVDFHPWRDFQNISVHQDALVFPVNLDSPISIPIAFIFVDDPGISPETLIIVSVYKCISAMSKGYLHELMIKAKQPTCQGVSC